MRYNLNNKYIGGYMPPIYFSSVVYALMIASIGVGVGSRPSSV